MSHTIIHSRPLDVLDALQRWGHIKILQTDLDRALESDEGHPRRASQLSCLERAFDTCFDCPESLVQFHQETAALRWPGRSPWPDIARMAERFVTHGRLDHVEPGEPPAHAVILRLQQRVDSIWARPRHGFAYVFQQETENGLWTSIPRWAGDEREVRAAVNAGWLKGQSRWAVQIGGAGLDAPRFVCGVSRDGRGLAGEAVASIIRATVVTTEVAAPALGDLQGEPQNVLQDEERALAARRAMRHAA